MFSRELCIDFSSHSTWKILGVSNYLAYLTLSAL
jgi:hypothetical protein